jgi:hypothetical protein
MTTTIITTSLSTLYFTTTSPSTLSFATTSTFMPRSKPRSLLALPTYLAHPNVAIAARVSAGDNKCIACWRPFNTIEDVWDLTERPCIPLRIQPCNHLIGSVCLREIIRRNMAACPHCAASITIKSAVPSWLIYLLSCDKFFPPTKWLASVDGIVRQYQPASVPILKRLHHKLVNGKLTKEEAFELWLYYMVSPLVDMTFASLFCLSTRCYAILKNRLFDMLPPLQYTVIYTFFGMHVRIFTWRLAIETVADPIYAYLLLMAGESNAGGPRLGATTGIVTMYLGWRIVRAFLTAIAMVYGGMVAYLIWLGMNRKSLEIL